MKNFKKIFLVLAFIALDQIVKFFVKANMEVGESIPVIKDIFHITYVRNTGAAWSIFAGQKWLLIIIPGIIMLVLLVLYFLKDKGKMLMSSLALIISGGIGNLIDRITCSYVCDMFDFRIWPVFNVADICVVCGCVLLCIYIIFYSDDRKK
ncbi:MAG: signal peptidase II [Clostridia bacterium]|nr:signal peptidase II [Clostridia bacterium]